MTEKQSDIVTYIVSIAVILVLFLLFSGCKTQRIYVPVETIRTEYKDRLQRDSIRLYDSIFVDRYTKGDTVFLTKEKYRYLYRDKLVRDTVIKQDSIPYIKEILIKGDTVYKMKWYEEIIFYIGLVFIFVLISYLGFKVIRK